MNMTMMSIERIRTGFPFCIMILIISLSILSVFWKEESGASFERRLELRTFQWRKGWGYQVLANEKVLINQPFIPAIDTIMAFPDEESARKIGALVLDKWAGGESPSVTQWEIRHSLSYLGQ